MYRSALVGLLTLASVYAGTPPTLQAQPRSEDEAVVIVAAVSHMLQLLRANDGVPAGPIQFDPRVLQSRQIVNPAGGTVGYVTSYELSGTREESVAASMLATLGADAGSFDDARVCPTESLRTCTLRQGVAVFATGDPAISADSAEVVVKAMWLGDLAKQPVQDGIFRVTLRRHASRWQVVATQTLRIS